MTIYNPHLLARQELVETFVARQLTLIVGWIFSLSPKEVIFLVNSKIPRKSSSFSVGSPIMK